MTGAVEAAPSNPKGLMSNDTVKSLFAGGIAGALAKTVVAPLERVKILFQIVKNEGILALFNGNMAVCIRIFPYSGIQYMSYDLFKHKLYPADHSEVTAVQRLSAGACAGVSAVCATYPLDLVRVRLACQQAGEPKRYRGMLHCIRRIVAEEGGIMALYRGVTPTLIGIIPYAAINFSTYEVMKIAVLALDLCRNENTGEPKVWARLGCGAVAGSVGQTVTYPLDTVRRRMQMNIGSALELQTASSKGELVLIPVWLRLIVRIVKTEGFRGLFRGITINYLRVVPMISTSFVTYDLLKDALGVRSRGSPSG